MKTCWVIGIVMAAAMQAQPQDCKVDVYLASGVPTGGMLLDASTRAAQMFREIGVDVRMRIGRPGRDPIESCTGPIVVEFERAVGYHGGPYELARATPYKESGACIHVFIDRVLEEGRKRGFSNALLAHVLAHEITHVLEKIARHSEEGVMKARWSLRDYESMKRHPLPFAPVDVDLIRMGLAGQAHR